MTRDEQLVERHKRFHAAMSELVANPLFERYIDAIRMETDTAVDGLPTITAAGNAFAIGAAIGEITAYRTMVRFYDEFKNRPPEQHIETTTE